jgi:hypothetical protein
MVTLPNEASVDTTVCIIGPNKQTRLNTHSFNGADVPEHASG